MSAATRTTAALALLVTIALVGCPLPQPLPDYPPGTITPPRILADEIQVDGVPSNSRAVVLVPASCAGPEPVYRLSAQIHDTNTIEQVEARWFVNYHPSFAQQYYTAWQTDAVPPSADPVVLTRNVPPDDPGTGEKRPFLFLPYQYAPPVGTPAASGPPYPGPNTVRVVELVVSNGFDPAANTPPSPLPKRTPLPGFETQVYRWVFLTVPESAGPCDPASDPTCVKCPP